MPFVRLNSGKLHNLAKALAIEEAESNYLKGKGSYDSKRALLYSEKGAIVGLGLKTPKSSSVNPENAESTPEIFDYEMKDSGKRFFGPVTSKPSTYLSAFIIYIATIGDIVDGVDTTHDFNFFSLIYEWPKDVRKLNFVLFPYSFQSCSDVFISESHASLFFISFHNFSVSAYALSDIFLFHFRFPTLLGSEAIGGWSTLISSVLGTHVAS